MNPYGEPRDPEIHTMNDLFGNLRMAPAKKRQTERGELLRYFSERTEKPISYIAYRLAKMQDLATLYHIKASADAYEREKKGPWTKAFYGMLKTP